MNVLVENVTLLPGALGSSLAQGAEQSAETWDIGISDGLISFVRAHTTPFQALGHGCDSACIQSSSCEDLETCRIWDKVIPGGKRLALPGLVNAHTHLGMTILRGYGDDLPLMVWLQEKMWPMEANLTEDDVYWASLLAIAEMFKGGVTACGDMYFHMDATAKAVTVSGMRASLSRGLQDIGGSGEQGLREAVELCQRWHHSADGRITTMLGPHAPFTCSPGFLRQIVDKAQDLNVPLHVHVAETEAEVEEVACKFGTTPLGMLARHGVLDVPVLAAHCVHLSHDDLELATEKGVRIVHCPGSNMKLGSGIAPLPDMLARGLAVGLGTDSAASNNTLDLWEEMRFSSLLHKAIRQDATVIPAEVAFDMATIGGANALYLDKVGKLMPGWAADLILVDTKGLHWQPLGNLQTSIVYSGGRHDVSLTMVAGEVVYENGQLLTIDEEQIRHHVTNRAQRLGLL